MYRDREFEEMDLDAILARKPAVALVDELAHTNVPGSRNEKRWQDVEELLDAGIEVISTVNIQHLESVNDVVEQITGVRQAEKIPDAIVRRAEQVEIVDMTPEALRRRMAHGNIYPAERVDAALGNYFRPGNLAALRELALLWVADKVDESLQTYMEAHGIEGSWETRERVVVAVTGGPNGDALIRRAARMAQRSRAALIGVHVRSSDGLATPSTGRLEAHRGLLEELGGVFQEVIGDDVGTALVRFAQAEHATQLVIGATRRSRWAELTRGSIISRVLRQAGPIDVHVISGDETEAGGPHLVSALRRRHIVLSPRRQIAGWTTAVLGPLLLTLAMANLRDFIDLPSNLLLYLLVVLAAAAIGGFWPAVLASGSSFALGNWFFTPPKYTFTISKAEDIIAFCVFLVVGIVVSMLVTAAARRSLEAARARSEAETLARLGGALINDEDPLLALMSELHATFEVDSIAVLRAQGATWTVESSVGEPVPSRPEDGALSVPLDGITQLVVAGARLDPDDLTLLRAFTGQIGLALESRQLRAEVVVAEGLVEANALRTALLAAVSHDLRTPLASIKASVTSMLQRDVEWTPEAKNEFLVTIDEQTDRLTAIVGNLLDMSRLTAGAYDLVRFDVGLEEVVGLAISGALERSRVVVDVPETLPRVHADPALLERAVANVVENAVAWSPDDVPVRVEAGVVGDQVHLRVVDRGPGAPPDQRARMFEPFQRLGDQGNGPGVGLGLAVARGFVELMGGEITVEDTPGGGLTMVVSLPAVGLPEHRAPEGSR
jgi:two-component system sensor histidine kinase KdpD